VNLARAALGLQPRNFSIATILSRWSSASGFAAFRYGRKNGETQPLVIGIIRPTDTSSQRAWISLGIGAV
jgi:hypothetical protein